jgi:hypothetical protein
MHRVGRFLAAECGIGQFLDIGTGIPTSPWCRPSRLAFLEPLINTKGWLGSDLVREDGAHACWLLVQHAPDHLQERWLPLLRAAVAAGSGSERDLAYLQDRVDMHNHRRQQYGTQHFGTHAGPIRLWPVTDATGVNTRRARLDLPPITQDVLDGAWTREALAEHGIHLDDWETQQSSPGTAPAG